MIKQLTIVACIALTACASPGFEPNSEYQANYQLSKGIPASQLSNEQICEAIEPAYGPTYASAVAEAQKRGLTKCKWSGYP